MRVEIKQANCITIRTFWWFKVAVNKATSYGRVRFSWAWREELLRPWAAEFVIVMEMVDERSVVIVI